jgi:hypothetical protein
VVLCHRLIGIGPNPSTKDAELIAFRVGEYHPRRVTLPDIGRPSTEGKETFDFCGLIDRTEVRMESVLACLLLRNRHEQQARHPIRSRPDLELVRGVAHDNPAQGLGPPSTKRDRIVSVDDDLLPNEIHVAHSARSVSQADPPTGARDLVRIGTLSEARPGMIGEARFSKLKSSLRNLAKAKRTLRAAGLRWGRSIADRLPRGRTPF